MDERIRMERFQFLAVGQYSQHATYSLFAYGHMLATTVMHLMNSIYLLFLLFPHFSLLFVLSLSLFLHSVHFSSVPGKIGHFQ